MQIHSLPEQTTIADTDQFALDTGTTTRRTPFSVIKDTVKTYALKFSSLSSQSSASTTDVLPIDSGNGAKKITFANLITSIFNRNTTVNGTLTSTGTVHVGSGSRTIAVHSSATKGTTPSGAIYSAVNFQDSADGTGESARLGSVRHMINSSNDNYCGLYAYKPTAGSTDAAYVRVKYPADSTPTVETSSPLNVTGAVGTTQVNITRTAEGGVAIDTTGASSPVAALVRLNNGLHSGQLGVYGSGNFGLNSATNSKMLIYMNQAGDCFARNADDSARRIVGTASTDGNRVSYIDNASSTTVRVYGQKGTSGAGYSGYVTLTGTSGSDIRLKENIKDAETDGLPLINAIEMKAFDWKAGQREYTHQPIGMIADQIEKLDKRLVIGGGTDPDGTPNYKTIDDHYLICYLVKAVQELSAELAELKGEK